MQKNRVKQQEGKKGGWTSCPKAAGVELIVKQLCAGYLQGRQNAELFQLNPVNPQ